MQAVRLATLCCLLAAAPAAATELAVRVRDAKGLPVSDAVVTLDATGLEWRLERRGDAGSMESALTAFGGNDTAGELLAARGWALSDRAYGVGGTIREPDTAAFEAPPPRRFDPFTELDHRPGAIAEATVRRAGGQRFTLLRYDNNADPTIETHQGAHEI